MRRRVSGQWFRGVICAVALCCLPLAATAHDLFLKADEFRLAPDSDNVIRLINGTFEKSENAITRDRMLDVSVVGGGTTVQPKDDAWRDDANSSYLSYSVGSDGTYIVGVSTKTSIITLDPASFVDYLKHDGILDTLETFEKTNTLPEVRERYAKHVKAVLQVGAEQSGDYAAELGYPAEIIPEANPYSLTVGDRLGVRILHNGKPVANQIVYASYDGYHGHDSSGGHTEAHAMRTDKDGRAGFVVDHAAKWYVTFIHMEKLASDPDADYESTWATLTFEVQKGNLKP